MPFIAEVKAILLDLPIPAEIVEALDPDVPLVAQGLDSADFPLFILALEERYRVAISDVDSLRLRTLHDVAAFLDAAAR